MIEDSQGPLSKSYVSDVCVQQNKTSSSHPETVIEARGKTDPPCALFCYLVALALPLDTGLPGMFMTRTLEELTVASSSAGSFSGRQPPPVLGTE